MKYYAVFLPMLDVELSQTYRPEHLEYLEQRAKEGKILARGRFTDGWGGMVIYKAGSIAEVQQMVDEDPYIVHRARTYEIHEWEMLLTE
ncbi:YciI family protein [Paenibacillus chartarius]|uniref:YciI family protein n=1 Tax=Paenibacillus chartarius TaxID=747481 RepID=A0ABV6DMU4_9BACL